MKQSIVFAAIILLFFFSCKNQKHSDIVSGIIDIEHGLQNLTRLKVSDFGQTIRYLFTDNDIIGYYKKLDEDMNPIVILVEWGSEGIIYKIIQKQTETATYTNFTFAQLVVGILHIENICCIFAFLILKNMYHLKNK